MLPTSVCVIGPQSRWAKRSGAKKQAGFCRRLAQKLVKIGDFEPFFAPKIVLIRAAVLSLASKLPAYPNNCIHGRHQPQTVGSTSTGSAKEQVGGNAEKYSTVAF